MDEEPDPSGPGLEDAEQEAVGILLGLSAFSHPQKAGAGPGGVAQPADVFRGRPTMRVPAPLGGPGGVTMDAVQVAHPVFVPPKPQLVPPGHSGWTGAQGAQYAGSAAPRPSVQVGASSSGMYSQKSMAGPPGRTVLLARAMPADPLAQINVDCEFVRAVTHSISVQAPTLTVGTNGPFSISDSPS
jgi:hypothetical protein